MPNRNKFALALCLSAMYVWAAETGFRSRAQLDAQYRRHAAEFGNITRDEYVRMARRLRDTPAKAHILQAVREDGVITKFDRKRGYFGVYNPDGTIRDFLRPSEGENYFKRQTRRNLQDQ